MRGGKEMSTTSRSAALGMLAAISLAITIASAADKKEFRYTVKHGASITVINEYGSVRLRASGVNQVVVSATPSSPQVEVRDSNGHVRVRTVGGPIRLSNLKDGFVEATSVGGSVDLDHVAGRVVSVDTTSGAIAYAGDFGGAGQYSLTSHSGSIDVSLAARASVDLTARSVTGTVENDFPLQAPVHPLMAQNQGKWFAGTSNTGASAVRLRTFSGKIRVKKQ